ncbi:MAG: hypothetical protein IPL78_15945 [Chloroflexi bacterium]|nr:hypothetical protein [Chloroflexota bacterium]
MNIHLVDIIIAVIPLGVVLWKWHKIMQILSKNVFAVLGIAFLVLSFLLAFSFEALVDIPLVGNFFKGLLLFLVALGGMVLKEWWLKNVGIAER